LVKGLLGLLLVMAMKFRMHLGSINFCLAHELEKLVHNFGVLADAQKLCQTLALQLLRA
jgi:hypothetical protein